MWNHLVIFFTISTVSRAWEPNIFSPEILRISRLTTAVLRGTTLASGLNGLGVTSGITGVISGITGVISEITGVISEITFSYLGDADGLRCLNHFWLTTFWENKIPFLADNILARYLVTFATRAWCQSTFTNDLDQLICYIYRVDQPNLSLLNSIQTNVSITIVRVDLDLDLARHDLHRKLARWCWLDMENPFLVSECHLELSEPR